jgi:hypothetical protein
MMSLLKYATIVNQNGESSKSTKRKTTDHQQEKIIESNKIFFYRNEQSVGHGFEMKPREWYVHGAKNIGQVDSDLGECLQKSSFHTAYTKVDQ